MPVPGVQHLLLGTTFGTDRLSLDRQNAENCPWVWGFRSREMMFKRVLVARGQAAGLQPTPQAGRCRTRQPLARAKYWTCTNSLVLVRRPGLSGLPVASPRSAFCLKHESLLLGKATQPSGHGSRTRPPPTSSRSGLPLRPLTWTGRPCAPCAQGLMTREQAWRLRGQS